MQSFITILRDVRDPRDINARHEVSTLLFLALAGTLCGAKSCVEIADFVAGTEEELSAIVDLPHGPPSHDTFSRLFRLLDPGEMAKAFGAFMAAMRAELGLPPPRGVVAIDAKSLRRGYEKGRPHLPPLMVSVWDSETRLAIAQARAPGGSEVSATLALLRGLVLKGATVTADALHCHPAMAQAVLAAKAHYALGLKGNNAPLHAQAERLFATAGAEAPSFASEEKAHGRFEWRRASVLPAPAAARALLPGLKALGRIEARRARPGGKTETATRYVALSRLLAPAKLLAVTRAHWGIENQLHWMLDVVFDEDDARTRKDYGKSRRHPPMAPQHLANASVHRIHQQKNTPRHVEQRLLLQSLCSYAIALPPGGGISTTSPFDTGIAEIVCVPKMGDSDLQAHNLKVASSNLAPATK